MSSERNEPVMAPITAEDIAAFHRNAPAALARRGGNFLGEQLGAAFETLITGLVPIIGMLAYGWSANQLLVFLLVGAWTAIVLDGLKLVLLYEGVKRFGATHYDDWHVWIVAQALREGKTEAVRSHLKAKYQPEMGVVVDLLLGGVATVAILAAASGESWSGLRELFADRSVRYGLAILVVYQIIFAAWEIIRRVVAKDAGEVKIAVGMRGGRPVPADVPGRHDPRVGRRQRRRRARRHADGQRLDRRARRLQRGRAGVAPRRNPLAARLSAPSACSFR